MTNLLEGVKMTKFKQSDNLKALRFLKELQDEMTTQDTDGQATPRYWMIRDIKPQLTQSGCYENAVLSVDGGNTGLDGTYGVDEFINKVISYFFTEFDLDELERLKTYRDLKDLDEVLEWVSYNYDEEYEVEYWEDRPVISTNSMFITKKDAVEHLKANQHHYHEKAHTYAVTAWRSPSVERLYDIIEGVNWEQLENLVETK